MRRKLPLFTTAGKVWGLCGTVRSYEAQRAAICDDICYQPKAKPEHQFAAQFFDTIRDQTATAVYTTPQGWKDLGYIGNVAMPKFEGPNAEIRRKIGLE